MRQSRMVEIIKNTKGGSELMCKYCKLLSGDYKFLNSQDSLWMERHLDTYTIESEDGSVEIKYCPMCR